MSSTTITMTVGQHLPPGVHPKGIRKPEVLMTGPDRVQRPLMVELTLHRCDICWALTLPDDLTQHANWHWNESKETP